MELQQLSTNEWNWLTSFPFPLAYSYKESVLEAPNDEERVRGIIQTFTTGIQYTALICASEYARADYKDEHLSWSLERLKRPLISDFFNFVNAAVTSLRQHEVAPLILELEDFASEMERMRVEVPVMVDDEPRVKQLLLRKALVELRNTLGHKLYKPNWAELSAQYLPHLEHFLSSMAWCAKYPLLRVLNEEEMARLTGAKPLFASELLPEKSRDEIARAKAEGEMTGLLLADDSFNRFLNLYPLMLVAPCKECQAEPLRGLTEETFFFNGDEGKFLVYIGIRHSRNTKLVRGAVDDLYESKKTYPPVIRVNQISPPELSRRARHQFEQLLALNINARRYLPQLYHPRAEIESALSAFLRSKQTGFFLLGESGIGKTSLLCRKVEEWSGQSLQPENEPTSYEKKSEKDGETATTSDIVLFYSGRGLLAQGALEERIMNDLYLEGGFQDLLNRLRPTGRRLLIVIDSVNEDEQPSQTLQTLCQFTTRYARLFTEVDAPLKVIFSFRTAFYQKTLHALGYAGDGDEIQSLFPADVFLTHEVEHQEQKKQTYRFTLEAMSVEETGEVFEAYRAFAGIADEETGKMRRFRPTTPFEQLSQPTRQLLTHPWYLRMALEAFNERPLPTTLWVGELLESFCQAKIYGRTEAEQDLFDYRAVFTDELVRLMRGRRTDTIERAELLTIPQLAHAVSELQLRLSPYLQLVDEGVLVEAVETETTGHRTRKRFRVRFAFDPLFEYLLAEDILRENSLTIKEIPQLSNEKLESLLAEAQGFESLAGAIRVLLLEELTQGFYAGFVRHVQVFDSEWSELLASCLEQWFQIIRGTESESHFWDVLGMVALIGGEAGLVVIDTLCLRNFERSRFEVAYHLACLIEAGFADKLDERGRFAYRFVQAKALIHWGQNGMGRLLLQQLTTEVKNASPKEDFAILLINCKAYLSMAEVSLGLAAQAVGRLEDIWKEIQQRESEGKSISGLFSPVTTMLMGCYRELGKNELAAEIEDKFVSRLSDAEKENPETKLGIAMGKSGLLRDEEKYSESAQVLYDALQSISEHEVSPEVLAKAYNKLGISLNKAQQIEQARQAYNKAVKIAEENKLWGSLSFALADLGFLEVDVFGRIILKAQETNQELNEESLPWQALEKAENYFQRGLEICKVFPNLKLEAEIYRHLHAAAAAKKDVMQSEKYHREAIRCYKSLANYQKVFEMYESLADVFERIGKHDEALLVVREALEFATAEGEVETEKRIRHGLIEIYSTSSQWIEALDIFDGWKQKETLYSAVNQGIILTSFGDVCEQEAGDLSRAIQFYRQAIEAFEKGQATELAANPRLRLAELLNDEEHQVEKLSLLKTVIQDAPLMEDTSHRARILAGAGQLLYYMGRLQEAKEAFQLSLETGRTVGDEQLIRLVEDNWLILVETRIKNEKFWSSFNEGEV